MEITSDFGKADISSWDRFKYGTVFILEHIFKNNKFLIKTRKKLSVKIATKLREKREGEGLTEGKTFQVERVPKDFSEKDFKKYVKAGIPCIFDGGAEEWECTKKWNLDYLEKNFGEEDFLLVTRKGLIDEKENVSEESIEQEFSEKIKVKDFVKEVKKGGNKYLRFCPIMESHESLVNDFDLSWLRRMRQCLFGASYQTFIGAKGYGTPLHAGMTAFFFIMAEGEKDWTMYPTSYFPILSLESDGSGYHHTNADIHNPDLEKYPGMDLIHKYKCRLKKGDILFIPAWYWHDVKNASESWGVSYRFPNIAGILKGSLAMTTVRIFLTNPSFLRVAYYTFFKSNISDRKDKLLTPKLFRD